MTSTHKKKINHQRSVVVDVPPPSPPSQPPFVLEDNLKRNLEKNSNYFNFVSTRSSSTESSASSTSTLMHVDTLSSTPVVIPTKFFYRRR